MLHKMLGPYMHRQLGQDNQLGGLQTSSALNLSPVACTGWNDVLKIGIYAMSKMQMIESTEEV
jgi:hypothetical protein